MDGSGAEELDALQSRIRAIKDLTEQLALAREHEELLSGALAAVLEELHGLRTAMHTRAVIEQAKGTIMASLHVGEDEAFAVLVRRSQQRHTKLVEVARTVVEGATTGTQQVIGEQRRADRQ